MGIEVRAMQRIVKILSELDNEQRERVVLWMFNRYTGGFKTPPQEDAQ